MDREIVFGEAITALAVDPNTTRLAVGSREGNVALVELESEASTLLGSFQYVSEVLFSPDGKAVAALSSIDARVWEVDTREVILEVEQASGLVFSTTEPWVATCSNIGDASSWSLPTGTRISTFPIDCPIVFAPDGRLVGGSREDGRFTVWRSDGTLFASMPFDGPFLRDVAFSPDDTHVALVGGGLENQDGAITMFELWGANRQTLDFVARQIGYSPDGDRLIVAGPGGRATIWSATRRTRLAAFEHEDEVWRASLSFSGHRLATLDLGGTITLWDVGTREPLLRRTQLPEFATFTMAATDDRMFSSGEGRIHVNCR